MDSALSAASSLDALLQTKPWKDSGAKKHTVSVKRARHAMLVIAGAGLGLAYLVEFIPGFGLKYLWWCINSLGACCVIPTVLSLFWERLSAKGIIAGVCVTMCAGLLVIVYGSVTGRDAVVALGYSGIIAVSLAFAWFFRTRNVAA